MRRFLAITALVTIALLVASCDQVGFSLLNVSTGESWTGGSEVQGQGFHVAQSEGAYSAITGSGWVLGELGLPVFVTLALSRPEGSQSIVGSATLKGAGKNCAAGSSLGAAWIVVPLGDKVQLTSYGRCDYSGDALQLTTLYVQDDASHG